MLIFGLIALTLTGFTWSLIGVVMGSAPKRRVDVSFVQFFGAAVSVLISIAVLFFLRPDWNASMLPATGCYLASGILNFLLLQLMSFAMQRGPNGIIWGIVQSGVLFPFLMGILFFSVPLPPVRAMGMILLISALFLFGKAKGGGSVKQGEWLFPAFASFLLCGIQQCISNLPSYFPEWRMMSPVIRSLSCAGGSLLAAFLYNLILIVQKKKRLDLGQLRRVPLWIYVLILQGFGVVSAYFLLYNGMDALAKAGVGSIAYPLLVSSCIIGFFLYSTLILREKNRMIQYAAFLLCLCGIVLICIK